MEESQYNKLVKLLNEQFVIYNNIEDKKDVSHDISDTLTHLTGYFAMNKITKDVYVDKIEHGVVYLDPTKYSSEEKEQIEKIIDHYVDFDINPRDKVLPNVFGFDSGIDSDFVSGDIAVVDNENSDVAEVEDNSDVAVIDDSEEEVFKTLEACNFGKNNKGNRRKVILPPSMDIKFYQDILKSIGTKVTCEKMLFFFAWRTGESSKSTYNPFATTYRDERNEGCYYNCLPENKSGLSISDCITPTGCRSCKSKCVGGVRNYKTYDSGLNATVKTLTNGRYNNVVRKLKNDNSTAYEIASEVDELRVWGTGGLVIEIIKWNGTINPNRIAKFGGSSIEDDNCTLTVDEQRLYKEHIKSTADGNAFRNWVNQDSYRLNYVNRMLSDCDKNTGLDKTGSLNDYVEIAFKHKGKEWVREGKPGYDAQTEDDEFVGSGKYIIGKSVKIDKNGPKNHGIRKLGNWQSDNATDIPGKPGSVVYSITKGTVSNIGGNQNDHDGKVYGAQVTVTGENGYPDIFYTHLQNLKVSKGQKVDLGTPIAEISRWDSGSYHHVHVGLPDKPILQKLSSFIDMETGEIKSGTSEKPKVDKKPEENKRPNKKDQHVADINNTYETSSLLTYSSNAAGDRNKGTINPALVTDIIKALKIANITAQISWSRTGHKKHSSNGNISRHWSGHGVDISLISGEGNGGGNGRNKGLSNPNFMKNGDKIVKALASLGYSFGEVGKDKGYLWRTDTGGNHWNHIHVSRMSK